MYKVIESFADSQDYGYIYRSGDVFPRSGMVVSKKRLDELATNKNKLKTPLIEFVPEEEEKAKVVEKVHEESKEEVKPKRTRKKAE